ncbi:DUF502 domain-containing protein [Spiribacter halobius]|nr:DUF502 domain-containing protein [Spiribacter halobius]UEX79835.1 DUF502 domain-containing protein [Spiribacter halobius]
MTEQTGVWQRLWRTFVSGLGVVLPAAITLYVLVWIGVQAEQVFGGIVRVILPESWYLPGLGIFAAIGFILLVGMFMKAWVFSSLVGLGERLLTRIPVVKTVYAGLRDLTRFVSESSRQQERLQRVVLVEIASDVHVIGFITDRAPAEGMPEIAEVCDEERVAVYMPMGYQIGGYTLYLPKHRLRPVDIPVEDALRVVLTANVNRPTRR